MAQPQPASASGVLLRSGDVLPTIGLGVYKTAPKDTEAAVASALALGYRHVDTAQARGRAASVAVAGGRASAGAAAVALTIDGMLACCCCQCLAASRSLLAWPLRACRCTATRWRLGARLQRSRASTPARTSG
jgi:hypothetical protein